MEVRDLLPEEAEPRDHLIQFYGRDHQLLIGNVGRFFRVGLPGQSATVRVSAWITGLGAYMPNCSGVWVSMIVPARSLYRG